MKTFVILACIAVACAWPSPRRGPPHDGHDGTRPPPPEGGTRPARPEGTRPPRPDGTRPPRPDGTRPPRPEGTRPAQREEMPERPEGPVRPLGGQDILDLMHDAKKFAAEVRGHFEKLEADAGAIDGSEGDLDTLGGEVHEMVGELEKLGEEKAGALGEKFMRGMGRLMYAGVEDEGQCHKILEHLMSLQEQAAGGKRQMSGGELKFWNGVAMAGKDEAKCIVGRFHEFEGLLDDASGAIANLNEGEGHAFEAEVLMGSLFFGYSHLHRQVTVFVMTMHGLMEHAHGEQEEESERVQQLRSLLLQAERLQTRMDSMHSLRKFGQKAMF